MKLGRLVVQERSSSCVLSRDIAGEYMYHFNVLVPLRSLRLWFIMLYHFIISLLVLLS